MLNVVLSCFLSFAVIGGSYTGVTINDSIQLYASKEVEQHLIYLLR